MLISIGVLVASLISAMGLAAYLQARALAKQLVEDVEQSLARRIERPGARDENGFACFAEALDHLPADLGPFAPKRSDGYAALVAKEPLPLEAKEALTRLGPWAAEVRRCGDVKWLGFVEGARPFYDPTSKDKQAVDALWTAARLTRLEMRELLRDAQGDEAALRCVGLLEVAVDRGRLNLREATVMAKVVMQLLPECGEAAQRLPPTARGDVVVRFAALPGRLAANAEILEFDRISLGALLHAESLTEADLARLPMDFGGVVLSPVERLAYNRTWARTDATLRRLIVVADVPGPLRVNAVAAVLKSADLWWLTGTPMSEWPLEEALVRNEDLRAVLRLLADLAAGVEPTLPSGFTQTPGGIAFPDPTGKKLLIRR